MKFSAISSKVEDGSQSNNGVKLQRGISSNSLIGQDQKDDVLISESSGNARDASEYSHDGDKITIEVTCSVAESRTEELEGSTMVEHDP